MFNGINYKQPNILLLKHFQNKFKQTNHTKYNSKNIQNNDVINNKKPNLFSIDIHSNDSNSLPTVENTTNKQIKQVPIKNQNQIQNQNQNKSQYLNYY